MIVLQLIIFQWHGFGERKSILLARVRVGILQFFASWVSTLRGLDERKWWPTRLDSSGIAVAARVLLARLGVGFFNPSAAEGFVLGWMLRK